MKRRTTSICCFNKNERIIRKGDKEHVMEPSKHQYSMDEHGENHEKRPIHPLGTATPKKQRQNAAFPESDSDISKVVELLKIEYNRRADFSPLLWSKCMKLQLQEVYTKLRLVSEGEAESSGIDVDDIFGPCEKDNAWSIGPCGGKSRNWQNHLVSQTLSRLGEWCNGS
ncbi:PREDICTED: uncharacterized protein LOC107352365 isoform X2 [Acropora digitifera]|uniref:uncharacterized protein LOC107352365 isoform X2 n=1 Tax=Acropora digitifera TaxID=70779 RepID=UPI00077B1984|nr:PREDICTED: uncharacterized protein LOC107352365 isoform X2 [Acropora digitifera]